MLTAAPLEALDFPLAAIAFVVWFRAELLIAVPVTELLVPVLAPVAELVGPGDALEPLVTVPETAFEAWVPLATWPEVLTYNLFYVSGFCQYSGATSMTTAY